MKKFLKVSISILLLHTCSWVSGQDSLVRGGYVPKLMLPVGHSQVVNTACFSPDGKQIITTSFDNTAKVWDVHSGILLHDLIGHSDAIISAQYSPNGQLIVTASSDKTIKVWEAHSGKLQLDIASHNSRVNYAQFSPDGLQIVTISWDETAKIWNANSGKLIHELIGHNSWVWSVSYSPDGMQIVTASRDGKAKVWDKESGELIHDLVGHSSSIMSTQFSPDGNYILTASVDSTAKVWDANTGKLLHDLVGHSSGVWDAKFSPDGMQIVTASRDGKAKIWDAQNGKLIHDLTGHSDGVRSAQFSPDGKKIVTTSFDNTAKVWDAYTGKLLHDLVGHSSILWDAKFSPDGMQIVTASRDGKAKIWDAYTGKLLHDLVGHSSRVKSAQFSPDGKKIVTTSMEDSTAKIWDVHSGKFLHDLVGHSSSIMSTQFSPDGNYILTASVDSTAKVWDANTGKLLHDLVGHSSGLLDAKFSPDGMQIVTASRDGKAKVWDKESGELIHDLLGHLNWVLSVDYNPDGNYILTASVDSTAKVWDANTGKLLHDLVGHSGAVLSVNYNPDGKKIVTTSMDSTAKIWDAQNGKLIHDLTGHSGTVRSAQFSPDGKKIVIQGIDAKIRDHSVKVWDASSGKLIHDLIGHTSQIWDAKFSPDGTRIATTSTDRTVKVWDALSGKLIHNLVGHYRLVKSVQFSPEGNHILTLSHDGSIIIWNVANGEKLLAFYLLEDSNWVVLHPSGLFDASPKAMDWMYYVVGNEVVELDQLKERYYQPGLFQSIMAEDGRGLRDVRKFDYVEMYPEMWCSIDGDVLQVKLKPRNGGIGKAGVFINGKEILPDANPTRDTILTVDLRQFEKYYRTDTTNQIGVRAYNAEGWLKSREYDLDYEAGFLLKKGVEGAQPSVTLGKDKPHYYAIVVGTSDYAGTQLDLRYADKDSKDMASALEQSAHQLFGADRVNLHWLSTDTRSGSVMAGKDNIRAAFDSVAAKARPEDMLVVYFSGHGVMDGASGEEQFYYLTKDIASSNLSDPAIRTQYAISSEELTRWLNGIAAQKQVMILDACASGKVVDDLLAVRDVPASQIRALDRMKDRTGMFVLAGSAADKVSYEASQFGQGLLTYSLLLGMNGAALRDGNSVDVMQLFQFARDRVPEFAGDIGGIQTPLLASPKDASSFDIGLVTDQVRIPLEKVKPVFVRSALEEESSWNDVLGLSSVLDDHLLDASTTAHSGSILFVDAKNFRNAYMVRGRYELSGDKITLRARLFRGADIVGEFQVEGDKQDNEAMAEQIMDKISGILSQ